MGQLLLTPGLTQEIMVRGLTETVHALNEGRVSRVFLIANLSPVLGWECQNCFALHDETSGKPQRCWYCDSHTIQSVDLKMAVIRRAYRQGCSIEVMSRCPELRGVGGIGALLRELKA